MTNDRATSNRVPEQRFHTFSNGTEGMMWLDYNCFGCRKFRGGGIGDRRHSCSLEYDVNLESCTSDDVSVPAAIALRAGFAIEGPNGTLIPNPEFPPRCTERRGKDEPPDPRFPRVPRPPKNQLDLLDPRNLPVEERTHA